MKTIDIGSPTPLEYELEYEQYKYPIKKTIYLKQPCLHESVDIFDILHRRKSRRDFNSIDINIISDLLWHCSHTKNYKKYDGNIVWQHRPTPSAGGRHPIDLLIFQPTPYGWDLYIYDALSHCLGELEISSALKENFLLEIESIISIKNGTVVWFVAQPSKTLSKYLQGDSLIWRDSGVLLGYITIVAEALNLSCCPVGITGGKEISALFKSNGKLVGVGGCIIGGK